MATAHPIVSEVPRVHTLSVERLAIAAGATAMAMFVLCWVGAVISFSSSMHAHISLFTNAEISSAQALLEGACLSLLFGLLGGALFALIYNATASFDRK